MDNLLLEWICVSSEEEKISMITDLNYPAISTNSFITLYAFEESLRRRTTYSHNHKKIINLLLEFFYSSKNEPGINENKQIFKVIDEDLKEKVRCKICNYILGDLEVLCCEECKGYFHFQCLSTHQLLSTRSPEIYKEWVCKDCSYCQICYNKSKKDSMVRK